MRTHQEVDLVLRLIAAGMNDCAISRETGIPRPTVRDWRHGRTPRRPHATYEPGVDPCLPPDVRATYSYLLGLYLGDGCISSTGRSVYRLRITLDGIHPAIVLECKLAIEAVVPNRVLIKATVSRAVEVGAYSKQWPQLFPQHGPGLKHHRKIELLGWQRAITAQHPHALIRGLIHSDGCRHTNWARSPKGKIYRYPRYEFSNRSDDIRRIFCDHLDLIGIPWRRMNAYNISIARREAVARLDEFVGPKA